MINEILNECNIEFILEIESFRRYKPPGNYIEQKVECINIQIQMYRSYALEQIYALIDKLYFFMLKNVDYIKDLSAINILLSMF